MLGDLIKRALGGGATADSGAASSVKSRNFLPAYESRFAPLLAARAPGFRIIFEHLEERCRASEEPVLIVETGSVRQLGNWAGDGQSTLLWNEFAAFHSTEVHTVDLDPAAAEVVRENCGAAVHAHTGDSVAFLYKMAGDPNPRQIDLLYLDSFDFDPNEPFPSAFHHIKELIAVRPCLRKGSIVVIDDNFHGPDGQITGKGYLVMQWFKHLDLACLHAGYQYVWQL